MQAQLLALVACVIFSLVSSCGAPQTPAQPARRDLSAVKNSGESDRKSAQKKRDDADDKLSTDSGAGSSAGNGQGSTTTSNGGADAVATPTPTPQVNAPDAAAPPSALRLVALSMRVLERDFGNASFFVRRSGSTEWYLAQMPAPPALCSDGQATSLELKATSDDLAEVRNGSLLEITSLDPNTVRVALESSGSLPDGERPDDDVITLSCPAGLKIVNQ